MVVVSIKFPMVGLITSVMEVNGQSNWSVIIIQVIKMIRKVDLSVSFTSDE